jgi:hypothetical protein
MMLGRKIKVSEAQMPGLENIDSVDEKGIATMWQEPLQRSSPQGDQLFRFCCVPSFVHDYLLWLGWVV